MSLPPVGCQLRESIFSAYVWSLSANLCSWLSSTPPPWPSKAHVSLIGGTPVGQPIRLNKN